MNLAIVSLGCRHRVPSEDQQFRELFEGYQLVLISDIPKDKFIEQVDVSTLQNSYPTESRMTPGRIYVFRKTTQMGNETIALNVLPERLAKIGAHVTKAPQSSKDLVYLYYGGPLFNIEFEKDGHIGKIFNRVADPKATGGAAEWLILTYL